VARLPELFHAGQFVLLMANPAGICADLPGQVRLVVGRAAGLPPALLVRPDGYIAWASAERDPAALAGAARRAAVLWAGPLHPQVPASAVARPAAPT
jgi:aromatic ring hydroxylase-like protein